MSRLDEKRFTALGVEWTARFEFNSTCAIEEETGESFYAVAAPFLQQMDRDDAMGADGKPDAAKVMAALGNRFNSRIRLLLFHALTEAHELTIEDAGKIIGDIGLQQATELVMWAIARGLSADTEGASPEGNAKPAAPVTGTVTGNRRQRKAAAKIG